VSEPGTWLHVRAAGMDLLLPTLELREVVVSAPVAPLPGRPRGIQGVVIYQGEFLPVLAWQDLPGCQSPPGPPAALVVLRPRLGLPVERVFGTVTPPAEAWRELDHGDPRERWLGGTCRQGDQTLLLVDPDRLFALLHRLREER
jgi:chemotaxis signal transduction protein